MNKEDFFKIKNTLSNFKYTSLNYTSYENVCEYTKIHQNKDIILLYGYDVESCYFHYLWACNDVDTLINAIDLKKDNVMIQFIPDEWVPYLENAGFKLYAIWNDYINSDITKSCSTESPEFLTEKDCLEAAILTQSCRNQSRGFIGQTEEWMKEWINGTEPSALDSGSKDFAIIVQRDHEKITGIVCTSTYAHNSDKGPICWIREIAVAKEYQNKGIATKLIRQALTYGKNMVQQELFSWQMNVMKMPFISIIS